MPGLVVSGGELSQLLQWGDAVDALETALGSGLLPGCGAPRTVVGLSKGQLLMMPAESDGSVGVKVLTVAGEGSPAGARVKGIFALFDGVTLDLVALFDGAALTTLRTAAHSALAVRHLARADASRLVVFGAGPQGRAHIEALRAVRPISSVTVVTRDREHAEDCLRQMGGDLVSRVGTPDAVREADIIVCATTARQPLFDGAVVPDGVCVVAVGSHEPSARELDHIILRRAERVVVEHLATAMREAGDIIQAVAAEALDEKNLIEIKDAVKLSPSSGLSVFKGVGMGWQDLVVAEAAYARRTLRP